METKKPKTEFKKLKNKIMLSKVGKFVTSVGLGVLKSTPFGVIATEIKDNLQSETGVEHRFDVVRLAVWIVTMFLFVAKFVGWITFDDMNKAFEFVFKIFSVTKE